MPASWFFLFFVFGTIVGSFLNVVVLRHGSRSFSPHRSYCGSCGKVLVWFELVPLLSFLIQRWRCLGCKSKISWQYPLVECVTGLVFVAIAWKHSQFFLGLSSSLFSYSVIRYELLVLLDELLLWSLLIALSAYDFRHKIVPDELVWSFVGLAFLLAAVRAFFGVTPLSWGLLASPLLALFFGGLWLCSRGRLIGLGDAKLLLGFSPLVGGVGSVSAVVLGFWVGAALALAGLLGKLFASALPLRLARLKTKLRGLTMKSELPLAPFLVAGLFVVYVWGVDVTGLSRLLQSNY